MKFLARPQQKLCFKIKTGCLNLLLLVTVFTIISSCRTDTSSEVAPPGLPSPSRTGERNQLSSTVLNDPLFKLFDKAFYELQMDNLKYRDERVDRLQMKRAGQELKKGKIKTAKAYFDAQKKAGFNDSQKRLKNLLYFYKVREDLFRKYPELRQMANRDFALTFLKNRHYKVTPDFVLTTHLKSKTLKSNSK